jgi:alpha-tubulin suppressor-like RCC1 family protein
MNRSAQIFLLLRALRGSTACALIAATACFPEATRPRSGVPTLDDPGDGRFVSVSAGREHACALTADGAAWCWGSNEFDQLGAAPADETCDRADRPIACRRFAVPVNTTLRFRKISAGGVHTCALGLDDRVYCWGDNLRGALGDPTLRSSATPAPIATTSLFLDVAAGAQHSCAVRLDGVAACWGFNDWGQVGVGSGAPIIAGPAAIGGSTRYAEITASGDRTCGRAQDGAAFCWGRAWAGISGTSSDSRRQATPLRVQGTFLFKSVEAGANTTCGVTLDNQAYCWETNSFGTIGDGTVTPSQSPQPVGGNHIFVSVRSGTVQTCGIDESFYAFCWGAGARGELGTPPVLLHTRCGESRAPCARTPVRVSGWRQFSAIATGQGNHSCALSFSGNVYCWGAGDMGQRGDGRASFAEWSPVKVGMPHGITAIVTDNTAVPPSNR